MARLTRQELRKDELAIRFAAAREFFLAHQRKIAILGGAVLLLSGVIAGSLLYVRHLQTQAGEAFARALVTFHAPVTPNPPADSRVQYFKTDEEKYTDASKQFSEVSQQFSRFFQGDLARYYGALCQRNLGKLPEAEKDLESIAQGGSPELVGLAKIALAGIFQQTGREGEAEKLYQEMGNHPTDTVPKATAQLALAELYQKTQPEQAVDLYKQIEREHTGTMAGELASRRLRELPQ